MNQLKDKILSLIESRRGFTEVSDQLNNEIPQMVLQLRNYYGDNRAFYDILLQIRNRWGPIFTKQLQLDISAFTTDYLNELQKLEDLIKFAEIHPDVVKAKKQEIDSLTDDLSVLMDPFANVIRGIQRTTIKPRLTIKKRRL